MSERRVNGVFETVTAERVLTESHPVYDVIAHVSTGDGDTDGLTRSRKPPAPPQEPPADR